MKVLLVADSEELRHFLERELSLRGADLVHYWHPIEAMDNVEETAPELIIFSGRDFPRHWKPFLVYFRAYSRQAETVPFILLRGENFSADEQKKAEYLKVTAVISESFTQAEDLQKLKSFAGAEGGGYSYKPSTTEKAEILFTHPETLNLIQARIVEISPVTVTFSPLVPELCGDLAFPVRVESCSLSVFHTLITVDIEIIRKIDASFQARLLSGNDEIAELI